MRSRSTSAIDCPAVFVLHVRKGYEARARHMERMLSDACIPFEYILRGDMEDLDEAVLSKYFSGGLRRAGSETSCAMKHILAYREILERGLPGALVLEDDIVLYPRFASVFNRAMREARERGLDNMLLSFEESSLKYVARSRRRKDRVIYEAERDRFAGCYFITAKAACVILDNIGSGGCDRPIDLYHTSLTAAGKLAYFWSHPCVASQGSHTGLFCSSIQRMPFLKRLRLRLTWQLKRGYKRLLYNLR